MGRFLSLNKWCCSEKKTGVKRVKRLSSSSYLFYNHPELALPAKDRFDPWQPLYIREDFGRTNQDLAWVETVRLVEEQTLKSKDSDEDTAWLKNWEHDVDDLSAVETTQECIIFNMCNKKTR